MWNWIADQYENGSEKSASTLKRWYCELNELDLINDCFCCQWATYIVYSADLDDPYTCDFCPINFSNIGTVTCNEDTSPYAKLIDEYTDNPLSSKEKAELARQIANLPERVEEQD